MKRRTSSRLHLTLIVLVTLTTVCTCCYMNGKLTMAQDLANHDAQILAEKQKAEVRYEILASEADYVSVIDAQRKFMKQQQNNR